MNYADRVKDTTTTTGTGSVALSGTAPAGYQSFGAAFTTGTQVPYCIQEQSGSNWEIGVGTLSASTTLARTTVLASSNAGSLVSFGAGTKDVFVTLPASQIAQFQASGNIAFSATVPLTVNGTQYMPPQTVASVIAFTPAANPVQGASVYVRLTADGTNAPTFSGFTEWGGSMGYDNRAGIVNVVQFFHDGVTAWYSVAQAVGATPAATAITMSGPSSGQVSTASSAFTVGANGALSSTVTVTPSDNGGGGSFSPASVQISSGTPTATFTYTPNATAGAKTISATNNASLANPVNITYTAGAAVTYPRLTQLTTITESGTGPYSYTGSQSGFGGAFGGLSTTGLQSGVDGSLSMQITTYSSGGSKYELMMGVNSGSSLVAFGSLPYVFYTQSSSGTYIPFTSGSQQTPTNSVAVANGDIMRMRRSGTNMIAEVSKDSGSTWTTIYTWTGASTAVQKFQIMPTANAVVSLPTSVGLA